MYRLVLESYDDNGLDKNTLHTDFIDLNVVYEFLRDTSVIDEITLKNNSPSSIEIENLRSADSSV